jgi:TPP-dependent pyruvate/acetoin dehydrogenase alpha subunit
VGNNTRTKTGKVGRPRTNPAPRRRLTTSQIAALGILLAAGAAAAASNR